MNLRELIVGRILYAVTEEELETRYAVPVSELDTLSDLDLFELFEEVYLEQAE